MNPANEASQPKSLPFGRKPKPSEPVMGRKMESTQESGLRLASEQQRRQAQVEANAEAQRTNILTNNARKFAIQALTKSIRGGIASVTGGASEVALRAYKNRKYVKYVVLTFFIFLLLRMALAYNIASNLYENKSKLAKTIVEVLVENGSCRNLAGKSVGDKVLGGLYDPDLNSDFQNCTVYIFTETDLLRTNGSRLNPAD